MAETLDEGLVLFTGLKVIPKRTTLTDYSIRVDPAFAAPLIAPVVPRCHQPDRRDEGRGLHGSGFPHDPLSWRPAFLQKHFVSKRSCRQRGILTILARDADARIFCYAGAASLKKPRRRLFCILSRTGTSAPDSCLKNWSLTVALLSIRN